MRRSAWLLVLLGGLVVAGVVLATLPAGLAVRLAGERLHPLQLDGLGGTMWSGQARQASALGQPLGALQWRLDPWAFLAGRTRADVELRGAALQAQGTVEQDGEMVSIEHAQVQLPAGVLQPLLDLPAVQLGGIVDVQIEHALLHQGMPRQLRGQALWRDASVRGAAIAELGDIALQFNALPAGGIAGTISDRGGPLAVSGDAVVALTGFRVDVRMQARDGDAALEEALRWLGQPQADGSTRLLVEGGLLAW